MKTLIRILCAFLLIYLMLPSSWMKGNSEKNYVPERKQDAITANTSSPELQEHQSQDIPVPDLVSLEAVINSRRPSSIRQTQEWSWNDMHSIPYGAFWLNEFHLTSITYQTASAPVILYQYDFEYYDLSPNEIETMKRQIDKEVLMIKQKIPHGADVWETVLSVHDAIVDLVTYDESLQAPHTHDLYGALVNHTAVCSGYASAFKYVMDNLGIPCSLVCSETHAWNRLDLNEGIYIDTTWDDVKITGRECAVHDYFFLTRDEIMRLKDHQIVEEAYCNRCTYSSTCNYYEHEGFLMTSFDREGIKQIFSQQKVQDSDTLTIRFTDYSGYEKAKEWENTGDLSNILQEIGYNSCHYTYWFNDDLYIVNIAIDNQ